MGERWDLAARPVATVGGERIFVCDNLCFAGDLIALKRKHTSKLDIEKEIAQGLDRYQEGILQLEEDIASLKRLSLTERESKELIFDIFRKKIVPLRLFHPVTETYHQTRDPDNRMTAWGLYNTVTAHIKTLKPARQFQATIALGRHFRLGKALV